MARNTQQETAAEWYANRQKAIAILIDMLKHELRVHAAIQSNDPKNWGYAGDLGVLRIHLRDILAGLMMDRTGSERETHARIEKLVDQAMRNA